MADPRGDLLRRVLGARDRVAPRWSEARAGLVERRLDRRLRRRALVQRASAVLAVLGVIATLGAMSVRHWRATGPAPVVVARLADGSAFEPLSPGARLEPVAGLVPGAPMERRYRLRGGAARFDIVADALRPFLVEAPGGLVVRVLGTVFVVDPRSDGLFVTVERGHVHVLAGAEIVADLRAGEHALLSNPPAPPPAPLVAQPLVAPRAVVLDLASSEAHPPREQRSARPDWRSLAESGDYQGAFAALRESDHSPRSVEALLLAADVARLSGHPREALLPLVRIDEDHSDDPRAALAAFTQGRVLLEDLGRPREAARAFDRAGQLDPTGPLVADALAREVEAWSRAGDAVQARERATRYVQRFPQGSRIKTVRLYGNLD